MRPVAFDRYAFRAVVGHKIEDVTFEGDRCGGYVIVVKLSGGFVLRIESDTEPTAILYKVMHHV
ncbi:hypothetical protein [Pyrococcus sp. NA2]|uniref:hypothetical protein n=1 Tax=Pyrococcus sp. (strain NA2) TaxID=342949 RepID=UPI00064EC643|nr:hypothetical protein [Pyrococcus sp. NA2]